MLTLHLYHTPSTLPTSLHTDRGPGRSSMVMAGCLLDQMLIACQGFKHVKKVVSAVAACLHQALGHLSVSGTNMLHVLCGI